MTKDTDQITGRTKRCTRCGETKPLDEFYKSKSRPYGVRSECIACSKAENVANYNANPDYHRKRTAEWIKKNPEKAKELNRRNKEANAEKNREYNRKYKEENADALRQQNAEYRRINKDKMKAASDKWRKNNPKRVKETRQSWRINNPDKVRDVWRRARETPKGRLNHSMSSAIRGSLISGKKGRKWEDLTGFCIEDLVAHLESQFEPGMTWENYGIGGWEIDHIIPLSAHNYQTPDDIDFKKAWALSNLRPMWAGDNRSKHAKLLAPFQPSLAISLPDNDNILPKEKPNVS